MLQVTYFLVSHSDTYLLLHIERLRIGIVQLHGEFLIVLDCDRARVFESSVTATNGASRN